jgi:hypothetical protein
MIYQPSLLREVFHFYARKMNQKVYSVGVSKQVFNGPVGTTNGPDYGAVIDGAGLSVQLGTQEIRGASKLKLVGFDEKGKELESVELAQGTKLRLMINAESISFVNVSNAKVFIEDVRDVGAVAASSDSSIWISRANEIGVISSEFGSITVEKCRILTGAQSRRGAAIVKTKRDASPKRRNILVDEKD